MSVTIHEGVISRWSVEALADLLDVDVPDDGTVPELWHWTHLLHHPPSRDLGPDGHPVSGIPMPPRPGMRRMFAGGCVITHNRLRIGHSASRRTSVASQVDKAGRSGPLTFVTVRHEYSQGGAVAIVDEQNIVYRQAIGSIGASSPADAARPANRDNGRRGPMLELRVDEALLFRFSALTFNAHRIHYDRAWCGAEGYRDLVVHGPLQALMMAELLRRNGIELTGHRFDYRLVAPMIGPQTMQARASDEGLSAGADVRDAQGQVTAVSSIDQRRRLA